MGGNGRMYRFVAILVDQYQQKCVCDQGIYDLPQACNADPYDYCNIVCDQPSPPVGP